MERPQTLVMWGRGIANNGIVPPYLAAAPLGRVGDLSSWVYYAPSRASTNGGPWSPSVDDVEQVYSPDDPSDPYNCRGPFSVIPVAQMQRWLMLERCAGWPKLGIPSTIRLRLAASMLGPWSAPLTLFDSEVDGGLGSFIHRACTLPDGGTTPGTPAPACLNGNDSACSDANFTPFTCCTSSNGDYGYGGLGQDPNTNGCPAATPGGPCPDTTPSCAGIGPSKGGYPYGPFPIEPLVQWDAGSSTATLYFLMSTLNPYTVVVMQARLSLQP